MLDFSTGRDALAYLEGRPANGWPQLMICDISLGDENGYAIVRRLRHVEAERGVPLDQRLPAVALTGHAHADDRIRALMAGFQVHLAKPVDADELVATLAALAGRAPEQAPSPSRAAR